MRRSAFLAILGLVWSLSATGCALWVPRGELQAQQARLSHPTLVGVRPGMKVDQAFAALEAEHATVKKSSEQRERNGRVFDFVTLEARGGGLAPFDVDVLTVRFVGGELSKIEGTFDGGLTAKDLELQLGPAWARQGDVLRWFFESDKTAVEAYKGYAGGRWHVTVDVCTAGLDFFSAEAQAQSIQNWWILATAGPLPDKDVLPPRWVRQSTPEEALYSMARAIKERDAAAYHYLSYDTTAQQRTAALTMPDVNRGKGRTIVELTSEAGAQMRLEGDQAFLRGPTGSGVGEVALKRVRGRWFIQ